MILYSNSIEDLIVGKYDSAFRELILYVLGGRMLERCVAGVRGMRLKTQMTSQSLSAEFQ